MECARVAAVLQCCSHQSAAARGVTLPIITQGSVSQTLNQCRSQYLCIFPNSRALPPASSLFLNLNSVNSSESLNPPPHNTQLMQNKIFTTCKICPAPKFWVVYASGAGWAVMLTIRILGSRDRPASAVSFLDLDWYLQITPTILLMSKWTGYLMAGTDLQTGANSKWQIV